MHGRVVKAAAIALVATLTTTFCACGGVKRRLTINSNPPGALVYIGNEQIGVTPVSVNFLYYGVREIRLVKDGYETEVLKHDIQAPWHQVPPLDLVSDNFWPQEIRDERVVDVTLRPQRIIPNEEIYSRAQELRGRARQGVIAPMPPPAAAPGVVWPAPPAAPPITQPSISRLPPTWQ
jgi:hypothetical protein